MRPDQRWQYLLSRDSLCGGADWSAALATTCTRRRVEDDISGYSGRSQLPSAKLSIWIEFQPYNERGLLDSKPVSTDECRAWASRDGRDSRGRIRNWCTAERCTSRHFRACDRSCYSLPTGNPWVPCEQGFRRALG